MQCDTELLGDDGLASRTETRSETRKPRLITKDS